MYRTTNKEAKESSVNQNGKHFEFVIAALAILAFLWTAPGGLAQVTAERQAANLPELNNQALPQDEKDLLKGQKTPLSAVESSPDSKPDFSDLNDHLALIFDFNGEVRVLKHGAEQWMPAQKKMKIEIGDQLLTGKDSQVDIAYDSHFLNIARIGANTKAEFRNIEPTDIHMEDGSIFSALDGLKKGEGYQISTRTAVAGVRGTHLFVSDLAGFTTVAVYEEPGNHGAEVIQHYLDAQHTFDVKEGQELKIGPQGAGAFNPISDEVIKAGQEFLGHLEQVEVLREEGLNAFNESIEGGIPEEMLNRLSAVADNYLDSAVPPGENFLDIDAPPAPAVESGSKAESAGKNENAESESNGPGKAPVPSEKVEEAAPPEQNQAADLEPVTAEVLAGNFKADVENTLELKGKNPQALSGDLGADPTSVDFRQDLSLDIAAATAAQTVDVLSVIQWIQGLTDRDWTKNPWTEQDSANFAAVCAAHPETQGC